MSEIAIELALVLAGVTICAVIVAGISKLRQQREAEREVARKLKDRQRADLQVRYKLCVRVPQIIDEHLTALWRTYQQAPSPESEWLATCCRFVRERIEPELLAGLLLPESVGWLNRRLEEWIASSIQKKELDARYEQAIAASRQQADVGNMTGEAFEKFCSGLLTDEGWNVQLTSLTGDQGVDIIAKKAGRTVALQCKRWNGAVGPEAVQQVFTGQNLYKAQFAVVVSNARFTKGAEKMAGQIGVMLLHYLQLSGLEEAISKRCA